MPFSICQNRAFHVLKRIADYFGGSVNEYGNLKWHNYLISSCYFVVKSGEGSEMEAMWNYVSGFSHSIEVNYVNENDKKEILTRVYFPFYPFVSFLLIAP